MPAGKECSTSAGVVNPGRPLCSAVTANSVTLTWNPNSQVYYWYIARAVSGGSFTDGVSLSATTLSKQFTGLSAGTTYQFYFWWRASNADPWVRVLPNAACTTTGSSTSPSAPTCGATTTDSIILNWNANPAVHRWYISRATLSDAVTATTNISYTDGSALGSANLTAAFSGLSPQTAYRFYFWWQASPNGDWNQVAPTVTCTTAGLASYPTSAVCGAVTQNSVELRWTANMQAQRWHTARLGAAGTLTDSRLVETKTLSAAFSGLRAATSYTFPLWWQTSPSSDWHHTRPDRTCTTQTASTTPVSTACPSTKKYCATRGVYDAVLRVTRKAITPPTGVQCTQTQLTASGRKQITPNMLASMMLAIPESELITDNLNVTYTNRAISPMTLSRGDNMNRNNRGQDSHNLMLYSHMTLSGYKRAHWNPGVGPWQIDYFTEPKAQVDALRYGHAERADVDKSGYEVAKYMRYKYCRDENPFKRWVACNNSSCQTRHNNRYNTTNDNFQIHIIESLKDPTGGTRKRLCRWGTGGKEMVCYLYDLDLKEGYAGVDCCKSGGSGVNAYTPEAAPFISFTDTTTSTNFATKYAVWPKVWPKSGLSWPTTTASDAGETAKTIIRAVRSNENARFSPYNDDNNKASRGIAHHGLTKFDSETIAEYEIRIEARVSILSGGPLIVNNSANNYGLNTTGPGPEGWFDNTINGKDLQIYNCSGSLGDTLVEACWTSTNGASTSRAN